SAEDVAEFAVGTLTDASMDGRTLELGGPDNPSHDDVVSLYGRLCGWTPKVTHLPPALLQLIAWPLKPVHPGLSDVLMATSAMATIDERFDPDETQDDCRVLPTTLEAFVRARVAEANAARDPARQTS